MAADLHPVVLAVDDDREVIETYELWLRDDHTLRTATTGESALDRLDSDVDVVLLDRLMPGLSGREVFDRIRERGVDPAVAMLTAMNPDGDVVDAAFDAYLTKPVTRTELREAVATLAALRTDAAPAADERYDGLVERAAQLEAELDEAFHLGREAFTLPSDP